MIMKWLNRNIVRYISEKNIKHNRATDTVLK